jgi:Carboxypeptidase regulatory-like domain
MRCVKVILFLGILFLPAAAHAQASITGVVKDTSGAVLPGVTVEATAPVLIERVRSAVTDGTGQYRIENLRPGAYAVTFTLTGFSALKREGIELTGSFVATVNAELRVGTVAETVTVTGDSPIVDVQNAKRQLTLSDEVITAIPSARVYHSLMALVPGVVLSGNQDVGGLLGPATVTYAIHGGRSSEGRVELDGLSTGSALGGSGVSFYVADIANAQEVAVSTSGGLGEAVTDGPQMNIVPRQGGNTFKGTLFGNGANGAMQGSNYTQALKDAGLSAPNRLIKIWDLNGSVGGPIVQDRLWFVYSGRYQGNRKYIEGMYYNQNAGDPTKWTYVPDLSRQATDDGTWKASGLRLTFQATPRNKIGLFWDETSVCISCIGGATATVSPEAMSTTQAFPHRVQQATWTSPVSNRVLLEAGFGTYLSWYGGKERPGNNRDLVRVVEQAGTIPGLTYRALNWSRPYTTTLQWRASASYITGAQSLKIGYFGAFYGAVSDSFTNNAGLAYRFNNGVPNQFTMSILPVRSNSQVYPSALYAQEQWTRGRLTLQGGVRYEHVTSEYPDQQVGPGLFIPVPIVATAQAGANFNDITPRLGLAYDVFGNGKTAVKLTLGKYMEAASVSGVYSNLNTLNRLSTTTTRSWTDANGNFTPDCNLMSPAAQDNRASGGDFCGAWGSSSFGQNVFSTSYDPATYSGWNNRPYNWDFGATLTQQLVPRVSATVGYFRRLYGNFIVTDNLAVGTADYTPFVVPVPVDPRLPTSGTSITAFDVAPSKFGQTNNLVAPASSYGTQTEHWNGVDFTIDARPHTGFTVQGGFSTGRTVTDNCDIVAKVPETLFGATSLTVANAGAWLGAPYCHLSSGFLTQVRGLGAYTIPRVDVQLSATFQSRPGAQLAANFNAPNALVAPSLGRNLAGNAPNVTVNLIAPGSLYGDRINEVDFRVAKVLKFGRTRTQVGVDIYNMLNSSAVQTYNQTYGPAWLTPTLVLPARFAKVSAQFDF